MKTIAIISQKGGSGKTTLAVHLAVASHGSGLRSSIVDLDPQGTAASWADTRTLEGPSVVSGQPMRLSVLIDQARAAKAAMLLVDTAPNSDHAALAAAKMADLILIPCRPAAFDLRAIQTTLDLARIAKRPAFVVLNAAPTRGELGREAAESLKGNGERVAPVWFSQRAAFGHGVIDGRTAQEFEPGGKAALEVEALFAWLCGQVGITARRRLGRAA